MAYPTSARIGQPMDNDRLKQVVQSELYSATGSLLGSDGGGDLADRRRQAMEYYYGEPFGNEVQGRSQAVLTDVHDVIEWLLPNLLEIFTAGDDVVRFEPVQPEDEEVAKQATDYVNYVFYKDNPGFQILYEWFKDALLQKNGIVKVFWEESEHKKRETFSGLSDEEVSLVLGEKNVEAIEHTQNEDGSHDLTIHVATTQGRARIYGVAPENFLIARRSVTIPESPFIAERNRKTVSELIEEGYPAELLEDLPSYDEAEYNEERLARFEADDEWPVNTQSLDPTMREIWVYECYLKVDYDGDGVAELRKVTVAGPGYKILDNEPIDEFPFVSITPIPLPHKFFGMSVADEVMDLQLIKSTVLRQLLDNMYFVNNGRVAANERVILDDLLTNRPAGVVRVEGDAPVGDSVHPLITPSIGNFAYPLLEYLDTVKENRTGVTRYNQGMDADSLNKTATGITQIQTAAMKRQQLIARIFAQGVQDLMAKILHLVINHQDEERVIRLRNEWVPVDPRSWNADMDVTIAVGLGYGNKDQEMAILTQWMEIVKGIVEAQGGPAGPLIELPHIREAASKWLTAGGMRHVDTLIADITPEQQQQYMQAQGQRPDPEMAKVQMEDERKKIGIQLEHQRKLREIDLEDERKRLEMGFEIEREAGKAVAAQPSEAPAQMNGTAPMEGVGEAAEVLSQAAMDISEAMNKMALPQEIVRQRGKVIGTRPAEEV